MKISKKLLAAGVIIAGAAATGAVIKSRRLEKELKEAKDLRDVIREQIARNQRLSMALGAKEAKTYYNNNRDNRRRPEA